MAEVTIKVQLTNEQIKLVRENSLERVLNSVCTRLKTYCPDYAKDTLEDVELLKSVASQLWYCASSSCQYVRLLDQKERL